MGEEFFNEKLNYICTMWLKDPIYTIREAALNNFRQLIVVFGEQWAQKFFLPQLFAL